MNVVLTNPHVIAKAGQEIYEKRYKAAYEREHGGKFVAIDVATEAAYLAETPEAALHAAKGASPSGVFHLIRIGSPGAFRVSYTSNGRDSWLFA